MADYEFTSYTTDKVMNVLLTMEEKVCNSLSNCKDIKEGIFKTGVYLGQARLDIYNLLKAEQDKSYEAKEAREAEAYKTAKAESELLIPISVIDKIRYEIETERNAGCHTQYAGGLDFALSIIDKYKAESEDKE